MKTLRTFIVEASKPKRGKKLGIIKRPKHFDITIESSNKMHVPDETIEEMIEDSAEQIIDALLHDKINALDYKEYGNRFVIQDMYTGISIIGAVNSKWNSISLDTIKIAVIHVTKDPNFKDKNNSFTIKL